MISSSIDRVITQHVSDLCDADLDGLLDLHLFGHAVWCTGYCEFQRFDGPVALYRCVRCQSIEERAIAARLFGSAAHPRLVPRYISDMAAAWQIVEAMKARGGSDWACFALYIAAQAGRSAHQLLAGITPRLIAIAALAALGVIDAGGLVVGGQSRSEVRHVSR